MDGRILGNGVREGLWMRVGWDRDDKVVVAERGEVGAWRGGMDSAMVTVAGRI
jgi:hypothetical protein